ncbi:calcium-binding protein [Massilia pseudoviolaceinigra]|uniref:calcium-binding protein n=1 Tax=Massilia pseudoviolaceinigra TaxID=3057165 RepID=UPI00279677E0|nr:calcium-binding protein [Massilia sp. CCM 9206]MDQ1924701.1 calcium-binding protein [Massilia sp. CCM 9206]
MTTFFMMSDPDGGPRRPVNFLVTGLTLTGTENSDFLQGGELDDQLFGLGSGDLLFGEGGNDYIDGGDEEEGDGDRIFGGDGADSVFGGAGNDTIAGEQGSDLIDGDAGWDRINGGEGDDLLRGGEGGDVLRDDSGNNILVGGPGTDSLDAFGTGADRLDGGADDDVLSGGEGNDSLYGGAGTDSLFVASMAGGGVVVSNVLVAGGDGEDRINFGTGTAALTVHATGGSGSDLFIFYDRVHEENIIIDDFVPGAGGDRFSLGQLFESSFANPFGVAGIARLVQQGNDTLLQLDEDGAAGTASTFHTIATLTGVRAQDVLPNNFFEGYNPDGSNNGMTVYGTSGDDQVFAGVLNDSIYGGAGNDQLWGQLGDDLLSGGDGNDDLNGYSGNDVIDGGAGGDYLNGHDGNDTLTGGRGNDLLAGHEGDDQLFGGEGDDLMFGDGGNDVFNGGSGNDTMSGYRGNDVLDGGAGDDLMRAVDMSGLLNGGRGNDILKVQSDGDVGAFGGSGNDLIEINANDYLARGRVVANGGDGDDAIILLRETQNSNEISAIGGAGTDRFGVVGTLGTSTFTVRDFAVGAGGDRIDVSALLAGAVPPGDPFASGVLRYLQSGADTLVQFDADGAAGAAWGFLTMMALQGVAATALTPENLITEAPAGVSAEPGLVGVVAMESGIG